MLEKQYFIPEPEEFISEKPLTAEMKKIKAARDAEIRDVIAGQAIGLHLPVFFSLYIEIAVCIATAIVVFFVAMIFKKRYVKEEKLVFKRLKTKELLAFLVDRKGAGMTAKQICAVLFPDDTDDTKNAAYLRQLVLDLKNTLKTIRADLELPDTCPIIPFSAEKGNGRDELVKMVLSAVKK